MTKNNQTSLIAGGLVIVGIILLIKRKKNSQTNEIKPVRQKSSYYDLLKVSAPILTPFAKLAADQIAKKLL